jgi:hypothetical protein
MGGTITPRRGAGHLYRIKPGGWHGIYAGTTSDGKQVLMGLYCPNLVAIFFDGKGNLLDVQQRVLRFMAEGGERGVGISIYDERIEPELLSWQAELGFQPTTISVHKFVVLEGGGGKGEAECQRDGIGIQDYPAFFYDALANPHAYAEEERSHVQEELPRWEKDGQFVLWWGNDYWFDSTGECIAS